MALPTLKSVQDAGNYALTVDPFLPQLYDLPQQIWDNIASPSALGQLYVDTNPLISGLAVSILLGGIFLIVSEVNRNYSQVDRMWSILPNLYILHLSLWARAAGAPHDRIDLVSAFSTIWSIRLTYNYFRRGGYEVGSEDYRWSIIKSHVPTILWFLFNVTFISFIQSVLLFAFSCVPAYAILLTSQLEPRVTIADQFYFLVQVLLVVSEWFSDGQQWHYQTAKYKYRDDGKVRDGYTKADLDRGFNTHGLWAYSRHPNFFAEQSIWFMLYQWSCYASNSLYSYTGIGSASLILLFQGSTWLTELITTGKYEEYPLYQKHVGMFIPKSIKPYKTPVKVPKIIRTSELAKKQEKEL